MTESTLAVIQQYLREEVALEEAALELSRQPFFGFEARGYDAQARARLRILFDRSQALAEEERLLARGHVLPDLEEWTPPADPAHFCLSIEVVLTGRDARGDHQHVGRLYLCTPAWASARLVEHGWTWLPAPLLVSHWDPAIIRVAVEARLGAIRALRWSDYVEGARAILDDEA